MPPRRRGRIRHAAEAGQALVEAAVTLPLLILVALGLLQFTLVVHANQVVTAAAQDGARVAAAVDATLEEGRDHALNLLRAGLGRSGELRARAYSAGADTVVIEAEAHLWPIVPWVRDARIPVTSRAAISKERFRA